MKWMRRLRYRSRRKNAEVQHRLAMAALARATAHERLR